MTWRLIPFLFLCYVFAYLDRVNVGFAKLQMLADLKFSETISGWIKDLTHSTDMGLYCVAISLVVAAAIVLTMPKSVVNR